MDITHKVVINVKNAVYRHVNDKIAQLKQQISELGILVVVHIINVNVTKNPSSNICCFNCAILPLTCL